MTWLNNSFSWLKSKLGWLNWTGPKVFRTMRPSAALDCDADSVIAAITAGPSRPSRIHRQGFWALRRANYCANFRCCRATVALPPLRTRRAGAQWVCNPGNSRRAFPRYISRSWGNDRGGYCLQGIQAIPREILIRPRKASCPVGSSKLRYGRARNPLADDFRTAFFGREAFEPAVSIA